MSKKLPTLIKINAMMKQRAEQSYAELVAERRRLSNQISFRETNIRKVEEQLFLSGAQENIQSDFQTFERWKSAQLIQIQDILNKDASLQKRQEVLKAELGQLIVKETHLTKLLQKHNHIIKARRETLQSEETQKIWLHLK